jgi:hypothetical protein
VVNPEVKTRLTCLFHRKRVIAGLTNRTDNSFAAPRFLMVPVLIELTKIKIAIIRTK